MPHVVFVTSEEVVEFYEKRGNSENYIKEAIYDMSVGQRIKKMMQMGVNYAKVKRVSPQPSSIWGENGGKKYSTFLSTHPDRGDRIIQIQTDIQNMDQYP